MGDIRSHRRYPYIKLTRYDSPCPCSTEFSPRWSTLITTPFPWSQTHKSTIYIYIENKVHDVSYPNDGISSSGDSSPQAFVKASEKSPVREWCWWCYNDRQWLSYRRRVFESYDKILLWSHRSGIQSSWSKLLFLPLFDGLLLSIFILPATCLLHSRFWRSHVAWGQPSQEMRIQVAQISCRGMHVLHRGVSGREIYE